MPLLAYVITIGGVAKTIQEKSFRMSESQNNRNIVSFDVYSKPGTYRPSLDDEVLISEAGVRIFGGQVSGCRETGRNESLGGSQIVNHVEATDFSAIAERRYFNGVIPDGTTVAAALSTYVLPYLTAYSITVNPAQVTGTTLPELRYEYVQVSQVLTDIAALAGNWSWEIDEFKYLRVFDPSGESAPFNIALNDGNTFGDIEVEPNRENYANRIIVRYNAAAIQAYAYFGGSAIANSDALVIGSRTYTFQTVLTNVDGHVLIGATVPDSLANLIAAITGGSGSGSAYAAATTINTQVEAAAVATNPDAIRVRAITAGAAGNSIGVSTTGASLSWSTEGGIATSTLTLGADESLTNIAIAEDGSAATSPWEAVVEAPSDTATTAASRAAAILAQRLPTRQVVTYKTRRTGLHPGQTQAITLAKRNLNTSFLVQSVETAEGRLGSLERTVKVIAGTVVQAPWQDVYRLWAGGGGSISGGGGGVSTTIISGSPAYFLGASAIEAVTGATWVAAGAVRIYIDTTVRGSLTGFVYVQVRARDAGISVTARLYNVTDSSAAGTGTAKTSTSWTADIFAVVLASGAKWYELQLLASTNGNLVQGVGYFQ